MTAPASILIVEDELAIRTGLVDVLVFHGFEVDYAEEGKLGLEKALSGQYDLILLDVMLPNINGFEICEKVRAQDKDQAIIMLTAKSSDEDIIQGLTLGADDYVAKPFSVTQLILRVKAVLRRTVTEEVQNSIELSEDRVIDLQNYCVDIGQDSYAFTKREVKLLSYLWQHNERAVTRDELLCAVWGYPEDMDIETRTVDAHIARVRRKIEIDAKAPEFLVTIRGAGYRLICHDVNT